MMVFSEINMNQYSLSADKIAYCKMVRFLIQDFVTREDARAMMNSGNLNVSTLVNTAVQIGPSGTGSGAGKGTGTVSPVYDGSAPSPGTNKIVQQRKQDQVFSEGTIEGQVEPLSQIVGD